MELQQSLLLVDDEPSIPRALRRALRGESYTVHTAHSGPQAIELMQAQKIDVVISDFRMPEMNGAEFLEQVRQQYPNTVRMMLSGQADTDAVIAAVNEGNIYKFLTKPWDNDQIREEIRAAFQMVHEGSVDPDTDWLLPENFHASLDGIIAHQPLTVVVGEVRNDAALRNVLSAAQLKALYEKIAERCGEVLVPHVSLARGLFGFAMRRELADTDLPVICQALQQPLSIDKQNVAPDITLGKVNSSADEDNSAAELLRKATIALGTLDNAGTSRLGTYSLRSEATLQLRHSLEHDMQRALQRCEFFVLLQPQVDARTLRIRGGELLVRWQHPQHGLISPLQFVEIAERNGFIDELGGWVLQQGIDLARELQTLQAEHMRVSVNVSPRQFLAGFEAPWLQQLRDVAAHEPALLKHLELEITEGSVMADPVAAASILERIGDLGISLAMDDFGTGHSSLAQLKSLPIDVLKLARSLIIDVETDHKGRSLASHMISMAKDMGFLVVVEGIETEGQTKFCQAQECDVLQGFAFHRPSTVDDFIFKVIGEQVQDNSQSH
ncbi:MAG: EAL domain-containing protein [Pseudomonadota bacterium]